MKRKLPEAPSIQERTYPLEMQTSSVLGLRFPYKALLPSAPCRGHPGEQPVKPEPWAGGCRWGGAPGGNEKHCPCPQQAPTVSLIATVYLLTNQTASSQRTGPHPSPAGAEHLGRMCLTSYDEINE